MDQPTMLEVKQGATYKRSCRYTDGTDPIPLTGYSGRGTIYNNAKDLVAVGEFTVVITDELAGEFYIAIPASVSRAIDCPGAGYDKPAEFYYQIELYTTAALPEDVDVKWMLFGKLKIYPGKST